MTGRSERSMSWLVVAVALMVLIGGCSDGANEKGPAETEWSEPPDYTFVLDSQCGERQLLGRFSITVRDGEVADVVPLDESATRAAGSAGTEIVPTLGELLDEARAATADNADVVNVAYDPGDRHPTRIDIDFDTNAIDDEACYVISEYEVGTSTPTTQGASPNLVPHR